MLLRLIKSVQWYLRHTDYFQMQANLLYPNLHQQMHRWFVLIFQTCGVAHNVGESSGSFCYVSSPTDISTYENAMPRVRVSCYPCITASPVPPQDINFYKRALILNNPETSFISATLDIFNHVRTQMVEMKIQSTLSSVPILIGLGSVPWGT